ncbi:hypothetical protein ACLOJK_025059 [Asimina triloba]
MDISPALGCALGLEGYFVCDVALLDEDGTNRLTFNMVGFHGVAEAESIVRLSPLIGKSDTSSQTQKENMIGMGTVLGLVYAKTRNLLTPITMHACWNMGIVLVLTFLQNLAFYALLLECSLQSELLEEESSVAFNRKEEEEFHENAIPFALCRCKLVNVSWPSYAAQHPPLKQCWWMLVDAEQRQLRDAAVKDWMEKLQDAAHDVEDVFDELEAGEAACQRTPTHSFANNSDVCGRDADKDKIVKMLLTNGSDREDVSVIPIVVLDDVWNVEPKKCQEMIVGLYSSDMYTSLVKKNSIQTWCILESRE